MDYRWMRANCTGLSLESCTRRTFISCSHIFASVMLLLLYACCKFVIDAFYCLYRSLFQKQIYAFGVCQEFHPTCSNNISFEAKLQFHYPNLLQGKQLSQETPQKTMDDREILSRTFILKVRNRKTDNRLRNSLKILREMSF